MRSDGLTSRRHSAAAEHFYRKSASLAGAGRSVWFTAGLGTETDHSPLTIGPVKKPESWRHGFPSASGGGSATSDRCSDSPATTSGAPPGGWNTSNSGLRNPPFGWAEKTMSVSFGMLYVPIWFCRGARPCAPTPHRLFSQERIAISGDFLSRPFGGGTPPYSTSSTLPSGSVDEPLVCRVSRIPEVVSRRGFATQPCERAAAGGARPRSRGLRRAVPQPADVRVPVRKPPIFPSPNTYSPGPSIRAVLGTGLVGVYAPCPRPVKGGSP